MHIELRELSARHPAAARTAAAALQAVTFKVAPGEQIAVIGPSGAGKTTLLHALACALKPAQGQLLLDDIDPWSLSLRDLQALRKRLFLATQTPPLPPRQRVVTAVLAARLPQWSLWQSLRSLAAPIDTSEVHNALAQFDLADKLWQRVDRLSGGERQRVGLARALLSQAALWLVDEPLSALDPTRARQSLETLTRNARVRGVTLIASLHQVDLAVERFPRVIGMRDGRIAFDLPSAQVGRDRLAQLYVQHEHELVATQVVVEPEIATAPIGMICR